MNFTGYRRLKSREQFCDDIPDVDPTIIVLDAVQEEPRDLNSDRSVHRTGEGEDRRRIE